MTAKTSQKLADALRHLNLEDLAKRAESDEFHDFLSPHGMPAFVLTNELVQTAMEFPLKLEEITELRHRVINGEFDASEEESHEWARSEDGQETFKRLME